MSEKERDMTDMTTEEQHALEEAFLAGFKASGEGYNGEYPFEGEPDTTIKKEIRYLFKGWLKGRQA
jgi:hypothetical protein